MKKTGYVIAKNKSLGEFFISSSAYDRPHWVPLSEATAYPTAEMAQAATTKLYKSSGAYEARLISFNEAMDFAFPDAAEQDIGLDSVDSKEKKRMVAQSQGMDPSIDPDADDEMGLADEDRPDDEEDTADIEGMVDSELGNGGEPEIGDPEMDPMGSDSDALPDDLPGEDDREFDDEDSDLAPYDAIPHPDDYDNQGGRHGMRESATMPKKPGPDAKPSENKTTANTMKATPEIKYSSNAVDSEAGEAEKVSMAHEDKVKVPANVSKDLKAVIAEFEKTAKFANTRDDAKASFCMTVVEAFKQLLDYLDMGTVESIKLAQIHMTSLMSPITQHLPVSVTKFIVSGGRKPTLKDLFDDKRQEAKAG